MIVQIQLRIIALIITNLSLCHDRFRTIRIKKDGGMGHRLFDRYDMNLGISRLRR